MGWPAEWTSPPLGLPFSSTRGTATELGACPAGCSLRGAEPGKQPAAALPSQAQLGKHGEPGARMCWRRFSESQAEVIPPPHIQVPTQREAVVGKRGLLAPSHTRLGEKLVKSWWYPRAKACFCSVPAASPRRGRLPSPPPPQRCCNKSLGRVFDVLFKCSSGVPQHHA